jgi:acylaminoacyl-peptidase
MVVLLHGGPFAAAPKHYFLQSRVNFLLQGYCLLVINYRGSTGYGKKSMDALLGTIGDVDVEDCGNLTLKALETFQSIVDPKRVAVYGGSHGGFLTGWLAGHPKFKDLWAAAVLWNPVINMSYMVAATDIPDWMYACCMNRDLTMSAITAEDNQTFYLKSPISVVKNVRTPSLILIGDKDLRVPPHAAYYYYHCLQEMGVDAKLLNYPDSGHSLLPTEHTIDANMQIFLWLDKYLMEPFEPKAEPEESKEQK